MIEWTPDLATGSAEIDNQHKELFARTNELIRICATGVGVEKVLATVDFLESYVIEHFAMEEGLMARHEYPALAEHQEQHEHFKADLSNLRSHVQIHGPTSLIVLETAKLMVDWLRNHIGKMDKALAAYLQHRC